MKLEKFPNLRYLEKHAAADSVIGDGWVGDATDRFFCGRSVHQVTHKTISEEYDGVWWSAHNFLRNEAYLFFLPALLFIALDEFEKDGSAMLADALAYSFLRMARGEHDDRLQPILSSYTKDQLKSISQFLVKLSREKYEPNGDVDDAKPAYDLFWHQYDNAC